MRRHQGARPGVGAPAEVARGAVQRLVPFSALRLGAEMVDRRLLRANLGGGALSTTPYLQVYEKGIVSIVIEYTISLGKQFLLGALQVWRRCLLIFCQRECCGSSPKYTGVQTVIRSGFPRVCAAFNRTSARKRAQRSTWWHIGARCGLNSTPHCAAAASRCEGAASGGAAPPSWCSEAGQEGSMSPL